jgi:hypothetical protein
MKKCCSPSPDGITENDKNRVNSHKTNKIPTLNRGLIGKQPEFAKKGNRISESHIWQRVTTGADSLTKALEHRTEQRSYGKLLAKLPEVMQPPFHVFRSIVMTICKTKSSSLIFKKLCPVFFT